MFWGWNTVAHVILLQAALVFYYLIWPVLSKGLIWVLRKLSKYLPQAEATDEAAYTGARAYRGKWRDTQYQRAEQSDGAQWQEHRKHRANKARAMGSTKSKHLNLLGLREPVHLIDIKTAYRSLARTYHPDRYASHDYSDAQRAAASLKMRQINEAYDWLCANA